MSDHKKKRSKPGRHGHDKPAAESNKDGEPKVDENNPVIKLFRGFQKELDARYDKHERIIKHSRDITIESKRAIFLLHRLDLSSNAGGILGQADEKLRQIENTKFKVIARELVACDPYQFLKAYSAGLQEYIEAVTFYYYLKENRLMNLSELEERLTFTDSQELEKDENKGDNDAGTETSKGENPASTDSASAKENLTTTIHVTVPPIEFILGVADLTGELMRRAINSVGAGDLTQPFKICSFLQEMESSCASIGYASRELNRKIYTLRQSLRKVENACYTLQVRGSEIPKHMLVDALSKATVTPYMEDTLMENDN